ncbi:MAG: carboxypeptidase regulatory-like domain-containing protein [Candidatus Solibacter sp.]
MRFGAMALAICGAAYGYQAAPAKGSIEGQVVNGKAGSPLKKATLQLVMMNPVGAGGRGQPQVRKSAESDETGRFAFTGLEPGKYQLSAERQGFLRMSYGARKYQGGGTPVLVAEGQNVKSILIAMTPQAVIVGKVLDEDGEGVADQAVRAMRYVYRGGKRQWNTVGSGQTSDIGEFRLPNLEPGRYLVATSARSGGQNRRPMQNNEPLPSTPDMVYAGTYYPSTTSASTAVPVDVGPGGEIRGIDVRLVKTRVYRVRGKVVGSDDTRRAVTVTLSPRDGVPGTPITGMAMGAAGEFELRNVPPGQYTAIAQLRGPGGAESIAMQPLDVVGNHVDGVVLTLAAGGEVPGTVKVVDASAPPEFKNVGVSLRPVGLTISAPQRSRVGEDLRFTLKSVPPVKYAVVVTGLPETCYVKSVSYGGVEVTDEGVVMTNGGALDITVSAAAGRVDAVVMDKDGKAGWHAVVALIPKDVAATVVSTADENGILSFKGLKPGEYRLIAWDDVESGAPYDPDFVKPYESRAKTVKVEASGHEAVQLKSIAADEK